MVDRFIPDCHVAPSRFGKRCQRDVSVPHNGDQTIPGVFQDGNYGSQMDSGHETAVYRDTKQFLAEGSTPDPTMVAATYKVVELHEAKLRAEQKKLEDATQRQAENKQAGDLQRHLGLVREYFNVCSDDICDQHKRCILYYLLCSDIGTEAACDVISSNLPEFNNKLSEQLKAHLDSQNKPGHHVRRNFIGLTGKM